MSILCRLFGHKWGIRVYDWPYTLRPRWQVFCTRRRCDRWSVMVEGLPFEEESHVD